MKPTFCFLLCVSFHCFLTIRPALTDLLPNIETCGISSVNGSEFREKVTVGELNEFPWLVLLEYQKENGSGFYCGGVLINNRYVLTAAHCIKSIPSSWKMIRVRLGEYNITSNPDCINNQDEEEVCAPNVIDMPIAEKILHEDYVLKSHLHDIALLRLENEVQFTDYIKPICLPTTEELLAKNFTGANLTVAGWAKLFSNDTSKPDILLKLGVPVQSNEECGKIYNGTLTVTDGQICAGGAKGEDLCRGVGGSALMTEEQIGEQTNRYAVGLVSFGPIKCGLENWPIVYTRVSEYIPWITSKLLP